MSKLLYPLVIQFYLFMRNTFCLNSVSSSKDISTSQLNTSKSKNLWSFSKDSRFKQSSIYCDSIYNIPSTFRRKGAAMGYGKKSDFTKDLTCSPGSSKYRLDTIFDKNNKSKKGFSMYQSRDKIPSRGHIPLEPLKVPAPNTYNNLKLSRSPSYTMRQKTRTIDKTLSIQCQNNNPGAGRYENPEALSPRGNYIVSKHKGTGSTLFNPKRSSRFFQFKNVNPGPGKYQAINLLNDKGHYPSASMWGSGKRLFDEQKRETLFDFKARKDKNPGPGSYRAPSDFGHYDGNVYKNTGAVAYLGRSAKLQSLNTTRRSISRRQ